VTEDEILVRRDWLQFLTLPMNAMRAYNSRRFMSADLAFADSIFGIP
jgi:hypothetical protein